MTAYLQVETFSPLFSPSVQEMGTDIISQAADWDPAKLGAESRYRTEYLRWVDVVQSISDMCLERWTATAFR